MRALLLTASALLAFGATMTFEATDANAVGVRARRLSRRLRRAERGRRGPQAGSGGPLYQGAGERGLREALRLTGRMAKPARFGYAPTRWFRTRAQTCVRTMSSDSAAPCR